MWRVTHFIFFVVASESKEKQGVFCIIDQQPPLTFMQRSQRSCKKKQTKYLQLIENQPVE